MDVVSRNVQLEIAHNINRVTVNELEVITQPSGTKEENIEKNRMNETENESIRSKLEVID